MSASTALKSTASRAAHNIPTRHPPAVVVSAGRMQKTVKVRMVQQTWNTKLRKYFNAQTTALVHDPTSAVRAGDIIRMAASRHSKHVKHIVAEIVSPFGESLDQREGKVLSQEERVRQRDEKRRKKVERRAGRGVQSAVLEAANRGWAVSEESRDTLPRAGGGREPLPGGHTKFGKIGDEAREGGKKVAEIPKRGIRKEEGVDEALSKTAEDVSRLNLEEESQRKVDQA